MTAELNLKKKKDKERGCVAFELKYSHTNIALKLCGEIGQHTFILVIKRVVNRYETFVNAIKKGKYVKNLCRYRPFTIILIHQFTELRQTC